MYIRTSSMRLQDQSMTALLKCEYRSLRSESEAAAFILGKGYFCTVALWGFGHRSDNCYQK